MAQEVLDRAKKELPSKSILSNIDLSKYTTSSKVEALVKGLEQMRAASKTGKAIVFSQVRDRSSVIPRVLSRPRADALLPPCAQYTSMIEIVEWRLKTRALSLIVPACGGHGVPTAPS